MSYNPPPSGTSYSQPNSTLALVSLITGILGLTFIPLLGSIVAVITGPMAQKEIQESQGSLGGEGLAKAGIILGWIGIGLGILGLCIAGFALAMAFFAISREVTSMIVPSLLALL